MAYFSCTDASDSYHWTCTCVRQSIDEIQATLLLGNASVSGQTKVGVSIQDNIAHYHCLKSVLIWSYAGSHFPPFGLDKER